MYKGVFWPPVFQKEKFYPPSQANLGRKQTAFSLEGPIQHTHCSQNRIFVPYTPSSIDFMSLCRCGRTAMITRGKWPTPNGLLKPGEVSSLTPRLFQTEQKVNVGLKPRGRMLGRLGTAKMKHEQGVEGSDTELSQQHEPKSMQVLEWRVAREDPLLPGEGKERGKKNLQHSGCSFVEIIHGRVLHLAFVFCVSIIWTVC